MIQSFETWLDALRDKRTRWVDASRENNFDRGIWNATVDKYADPSHFIFELLQNAEDVGATRVRFTLEDDRIVFEHDGRAFDRGDIDGITGIGNTTKLEDGHKIGCYGIGFKSVYVITERPEVHSTIEGRALAFAIEDLVVPQMIATEHEVATTRIILPLRPDRAGLALDRARRALADAGPRALLFLENIKTLEWFDRGDAGTVGVEKLPGDIRAIRSRPPQGEQKVERFLMLSRDVAHSERQKQFGVKAALRLNDGGELVAEAGPTPLNVFFETEENTGLHFLIHGPFQLTDNRANIKRGEPWNDQLIETTAAMVAESLPGLRDRGLLKRGVLDLLPNEGDELPAAFEPILSAVVRTFTDNDLIPAHGGGYTSTTAAIRGPAELRDLLGEEGLAQFAGKPGRRWVVVGLKNTRSDAFLTTLRIEEWGHAEFLTAFQRAFGETWQTAEQEFRKGAKAWFDGLGDEPTQRFYLALDTALKAVKRHVPIGSYQFVRLEDGRRHTPSAALIAPAESALDADAESCGLYLVKNALIRSGRGRGRDVEQFLRRIGVMDVDEKAYLTAIVRAHYKGTGPKPSRERNVQHVRRFVRWWKEHDDTTMFEGVAFLRAGPEADYHPASNVFFGAPYAQSALAKIYDGTVLGRARMALWDGYEKLKRKNLIDFLAECGVESRLVVENSTIRYGHPHYTELHQGFGGARATSTGIDNDYHIKALPALLKRSDAEISRLVWDAARAAGAGAMYARYAPNQQWSAKTAPSTLAIALRDAAWIPSKDGSLRIPRTMIQADLASGFTIGGNENWLQAIGFGDDHRLKGEQTKARRKAGELIGLSPAVVDRLQELPAEALAALNEDVMRKLSSRAYDPVVFPERETRDPERRARRLAERAQTAPAKTYQVRERSVRVSNGETRGIARSYLEDHYTNELGAMICQACHERMPFDLPNGSPYFEAPELLESIGTEHSENHLALCPTCAAKWQHANPVTDADLRTALADATAPEITVELAGAPVRIRFTQVHIDDVRTVCGIERA